MLYDSNAINDAVRSGDENTFLTQMYPLVEKVFGEIRWSRRTRAFRDEIKQECILEALLLFRRVALDPDRNCVAYLWTCLRNKAFSLLEKAGNEAGIFLGDLPPDLEYHPNNGARDLVDYEVAQESENCARCGAFVPEDARCGICGDGILCQRCHSLAQFLPLYTPVLRRQLRIAAAATGDEALEIAPWILEFFQRTGRLPDRYDLRRQFPKEGAAFFCDVQYYQQLAIDKVRREDGWTEATVNERSREVYT